MEAHRYPRMYRVWRTVWPLLPYFLLLMGRGAFYWLYGNDAGVPVYGLIQLLFSVLVFYVFLCFIHPLGAAFCSLSLEALLIEANRVKIGNIGDPVTARDLLEIKQSMSLIGYAPVGFYIAAILLIAALILGWRYRERGWKVFLARVPLTFPLWLLIGIFMRTDGVAASTAREALCHMSICYHTWKPTLNIRVNGALAHTIMSMEGLSIPKRSMHGFYDNQVPMPISSDEPDVFMILCESCFTSIDESFVTPMRSLQDKGFESFYLLSPAYGGNTPEPEFESLTGLSADVFPGVDYQVFFDQYREDSQTLVRRYAEAGYATFSLHNFTSWFWKRNRIHPRFGFQHSLFLDQMGESGRALDSEWPEDRLLYATALTQYRKLPPYRASFMYLITMHAHGGYQSINGDDGELNYRHRLDSAMRDLFDFLKDVERIARHRWKPLVIMVFGDHKPSLTSVFRRNGVLPPGLLDGKRTQEGQPRFALNPAYPLWKERARVSAFVRLPDVSAAKAMALRLHDKPVFCLSAEMSAFVQGDDDAFWAAVNAVCQRNDEAFREENGNSWARFFPQGIYAERLF